MLVEAVLALTMVSGLAMGAGFLAIAIVDMLMEAEKQEDDKIEKDYVYMNDGTPVEFNEEDQE